MKTPDPSLEIFSQHRDYLFGIAYRMLGTVADAEDMVQETFLRWQQSDRATVRAPEAWLSTVITRLCINHLKLARVQREEYVGPWLPEPIVSDGIDPRDNAEQSDSLSLAFLVVLETLSPTERAVYLLRDVFGYEFDEVARMVEKSEANCRQLLSRARQHVTNRRPRFKSTPEQQTRLVEAFLRASGSGDVKGLMAVLSEDVRFISDGGKEARALRRPIIGIEPVLRVLMHEGTRQRPAISDFRLVRLNGQPGFIAYHANGTHVAVAFDTDADRIRTIYIITATAKLRRLPPAQPRHDRGSHDN